MDGMSFNLDIFTHGFLFHGFSHYGVPLHLFFLSSNREEWLSLWSGIAEGTSTIDPSVLPQWVRMVPHSIFPVLDCKGRFNYIYLLSFLFISI